MLDPFFSAIRERIVDMSFLTRSIIPWLLLVPAGNLVAQRNVEMQFAQRVSEKAMLNTVRVLSNFGNRLGGSPSGDRAAAYVRKGFRAAGLPAVATKEPERLVYVNNGWELRVEQPRRLRNTIRHEWLSGFSPSVNRRIAPLRFLGSEREEKGQADSCVVLTDQFVDKKMYQELVEAGTLCILSYAPGDSTMYRESALIFHLPGDSANPIPMFNISYSGGSRLRDELERGTEVLIRFSASSRVFQGSPRSVLATLKGKSEEYYIVCAHGDSDSGGPGADDNASGVAGVLELSRILNEMIREKRLPTPERSILFAVWGGEYSSSTAFVRSRADELSQIKGVINFDQIGTGETRNCVYFESNDVPHNADMMKVLQTVGEDYADKKGFWDESTTNPSQGGTDSYVFLPEVLGGLGITGAEIPSVTVYTAAWNAARTMPQTNGWASKAWEGDPDSVTIDYSRFYHSSRDVPALTTEREPFNMSSAVKAVGIALLRLAW